MKKVQQLLVVLALTCALFVTSVSGGEIFCGVASPAPQPSPTPESVSGPTAGEQSADTADPVAETLMALWQFVMVVF